MIGEVGALLLVNALLFAAGAGVTRAAGAWRRPRELAGLLGTSFLAGVAAFGVTAQLLYVLGLSLSALQCVLVCLLLAATGALRLAPTSFLGSSRRLAAAEWVGLAVVVLPFALLAVDGLYQPLASWDAWSQWTAKAQALVALDGLDPAVFGNVAYADFHPDYPLLVPALEAFAFRFDVGVRVVHVEFWLLLAAFTAALVELLRDRVEPLATWAAAIAVAWTPKFGAEALSANADIPLAVFLVLAALAAWLWVAEGSMPALALVAVFGSACLATKLEGAPELGIVLAVAFVLALRRSRRRALGLAAAGGIAAAIALVPWRLWTAWHDVPQAYAASEVSDTLGSPEASRVPIATLLLLRQLFDPRVWLLLVPLALASLAVAAIAARRSPDRALVALSACVLTLVSVATALVLPPASFEWRTAYWLLFLAAAAAGAGLLVGSKRVGGATAYVAASTAGLFCALVLVYLFTPYDFAWHLGTSAGRVVVPLGLLLVSFVPIVLHRTALRRPGTMS